MLYNLWVGYDRELCMIFLFLSLCSPTYLEATLAVLSDLGFQFPSLLDFNNSGIAHEKKWGFNQIKINVDLITTNSCFLDLLKLGLSNSSS